METAHSHRSTQMAFNPHWLSQAAFPLISIAFFLTEAALAVAVSRDLPWLAVPLVLVVSHLMHGQLIGFHEASHGLLRRNRLLNEIDGILIGIFSLMSFSLFRAAHQTHHAHLATERDEELWPFVATGTSRWARILAACFELTLGLLFTPFLFIRTFLRRGSPIRSRKVRRRIWIELGGMALAWTVILTVVAQLDLWRYFFWLYLAPAIIAGNLQSWRKYIEHVGMRGAGAKSATRSIVADNWLGRLVALTLLHEPFHGVHHERAGVPHSHLPHYADDLAPSAPDERAPFPSYRAAFADLFRQLADPRVGPQWEKAGRA